jgi:predicted aspartyl protease
VIYTFEYDPDYPFGPAMPMVEIQIRPVGRTGDNVSIQAVVDSGADATILPVRYVQAAGVEKVGKARMRWGGHAGQIYDVYLAVVTIGALQVPGVRILADEHRDEPVLGRDVLNHLVVTLNGPASVVEISI